MKRTIKVFKGNEYIGEEVEIPEEISVTIYINGKNLVTIASSNDHLEELVLGFLFTESVINRKEDIKTIEKDASNNFYVRTQNKVSLEYARTRILTSGCSGGEILSAELKGIHPLNSDKSFSSREIIDFVEESIRLSGKEKIGVHHASALLPDGSIIVFSDIGRHNALDKLAGYILLKNFSPPRMVFATGRLSSEMVVKSLRMGANLAISLSTPTTAAINLANNYNLIIIGYARKNSFKVYTHPERIR
ncbi:MAG: formate dehydrogenase accessory sulfurtransferase FdhD [Actinobacteria bacterium]|nr:formate dehydrogenase accessory sulfurtransferase FdhD [Actinomycetota bacterium]